MLLTTDYRRLRRKFYLAIAMMIAGAMPVVAQSAELSRLIGPLDAEARADFLDDWQAVYRDRTSEPQLTPDLPAAAAAREAVEGARPNILAESLVLVPLDFGRRSAGEVARTREALLTSLYNRFLQVSTYEEMRFFSERWQEMLPVFSYSYRIASEDNRSPVDDLQVARIPASLSFWVEQGFPPMGGAASRYEMTWQERTQTLEFATATTEGLRWNNINLIRSGNMLIRVVVQVVPEGLLIYGLGAVRAFDLGGLLYERIAVPFNGRVAGILDWIYDEALAVAERFDVAEAR